MQWGATPIDLGVRPARARPNAHCAISTISSTIDITTAVTLATMTKMRLR
jgi:hypothetical protein